MTSLNGKVVVVTGSSSGIGKALVYRLVSAGGIVVTCARNIDALLAIANEINVENQPKKIHTVKCDVTDEDALVNVFKYVEEQCGALHAVVNNAGMALAEPLLSGESKGWMTMLKTNVMSVAIGSREAFKLMRKLGVNDGHIVNICGLSGHTVLNNPNMHFYCATKFAITAITEGLRQELRNEKSNIRVTQISPGLVKTDFVKKVIGSEAAEEYHSRFEGLNANDIVEGIMYALQANRRVNVSDILIRGTTQTH